MSARVDSSTSGVDIFKLVVAIAVLLAGIIGFYFYAEKALAYRVIGVLLSVGLSAGLLLTTAMGRLFAGFLHDSRVEVRKMVWPTRQETTQSTLMVVALVILVGLILWTLDAALFWGVSLLTGQGK